MPMNETPTMGELAFRERRFREPSFCADSGAQLSPSRASSGGSRRYTGQLMKDPGPLSDRFLATETTM